MPRNAVLGALLLVALAFATAGPAHAGDDSMLLKATVSKHLDGPYKAQIEATLDAGDSRNFYLKIKNRTGVSQPAELGDSGDPAPYSAKFFKGSNNITDQVQSFGYEFNVPGNGVKKIRMRAIRAENPAGMGTCLRPVTTDDDGDLEAPIVAINRSPLSCVA